MTIIAFGAGVLVGASALGLALYLLRGPDLPDETPWQEDHLTAEEYRRLMEISERTGYDTGVRPRHRDLQMPDEDD